MLRSFIRIGARLQALACAGVVLVMSCHFATADGVTLVPAELPAVATIDQRFQSFNIEMVAVTGGPFWKPYVSGDDLTKPGDGTPSTAVNRSDLFSNRPPIDLANARLTQSAHAALDVSGRFLLAVNRQGLIMWSTPQAHKLLADHLSTGDQADEMVLPAPLQQWLEQTQKGKSGAKAQAASFPDHPELKLHYMGNAGPNEYLLRLAKDSGASLPAEFSSELGLTQREGEVLSWLSKGKTNRDIAQILGLSPRTVDKHLEQIYAKLGVENRTAAAAIATNAARKNS